MTDDDHDFEMAPVEIPIDGTLDLHHFSPKEIKSLVVDYLAECRAAGIYEVRLIHGKGIGNIRRTVHATLDRIAGVASYRLAGPEAGSWGATIVVLEPAP